MPNADHTANSSAVDQEVTASPQVVHHGPITATGNVKLTWEHWQSVNESLLRQHRQQVERIKKTHCEANKATEPAESQAHSLRQHAVAALKKVEGTFLLARESTDKITMAEQARQQERSARAELMAIAASEIPFDSSEARELAVTQAKNKLEKAMCELVRIGKVQYVRPMKLVQEYADAACKYIDCRNALHNRCHTDDNSEKRDTFLEQVLLNLEEMLSVIPHAHQGLRGDPDLSNGIGMEPYARLQEIKEHLLRKANAMDANWANKVDKATACPLVQDIFQQAKSGKLPGDGSIMFFERGKLLQKKGVDGSYYPQFFDVVRYNQGDGRLDRLVGHQPDGYVVIAPKTGPDGEVVERLVKGRPLVIKEVVMMGGNLPATIEAGTTLGRLLRDFKGPPEAATESGAVTSAPAVTQAELIGLSK